VPSVPTSSTTTTATAVENNFIAAANALLMERCGAGHAFCGATLLTAGRGGAPIQVPVSPPAGVPRPARRRHLRELIVEQLATTDRPPRGAALARACGRRYNSHFRTVIAGLESEGVVTPAAGGYWLSGRPAPCRGDARAEKNLPTESPPS
jgi:hypothetical protein